jgi:ATP-dependent protease HslVU (ClpYQ) peptidase subunit
MYTKFIKELRDFYNEWWVDVSKDSDFGMIICVKGKIFEHSAADMSLTQYTGDYLVMGSGMQYALGHLHATENQKDARKRSINAVSSAIKFSTSCLGPIDTVSI